MNIKTILLSTVVLSAISVTEMVAINSVSADSGQGQTYVKTTDIDMPVRGTDGGIWSQPYGQKDATYMGQVNSLAGQKITAYSAYKDTDSGVLWVEINDNGQHGWVDATTLTEKSALGNWGTRFVTVANFKSSQVMPAIVHTKSTLDNRYNNDYGRDQSITFGGDHGIVGSLTPYDGKSVEVTETFGDKNGTTWARISPLDDVNNFSWVDASRLEIKNTQRIELGDATGRGYKVQIKSNIGDVWTRPYGLDNSQYMRSVASLGNKTYDIDKVVSVGESGKDTIQHWVHLKDVGWVHRNTVNFINEHRNGQNVTDPKWQTTSYVQDQYDPFMYGGISGVQLTRGYDGLPGFDN